MVKIYVKLAGEDNYQEIEAEVGDTVKDAIEYDLDPTDWAICGGCLCCATCHVYVEKGDYPDIDRNEAVVLKDLGVNQQDNSRLSCQIEITDSNDGDHFVVAPN